MLEFKKKQMPFSNIKTVDGFSPRVRNFTFDYPLARYVLKNKKSSLLFSSFGKTRFFSTGSLRHYAARKIPVDSLIRKTAKNNRQLSPKNWPIRQSYNYLRDRVLDVFSSYTHGLSPVKMWNLSIVSALIFGMFLMTFIYRYLGQGASALSGQKVEILPSVQSEIKADPEYPGMVLGEETELEKISDEEADNYVRDIIQEYQRGAKNQSKLQKQIEKMVKGYPIEKMVPDISQEDPIIAAFLVGIAKKESDWGRHVPVLNGQDCFNYWGYRGKRKKMGTGGHTCFDSRQDAVETVSKRIESLVSKEDIKTPGKMVTVWKCGYDCSWDDPKAVKKWISDVDMYFSKFDK